MQVKTSFRLDSLEIVGRFGGWTISEGYDESLGFR